MTQQELHHRLNDTTALIEHWEYYQRTLRDSIRILDERLTMLRQERDALTKKITKKETP